MDDQLQARADNLKRLAQAARFENLSAAEEEMLEKVSSGKLAICGPNDDDKDDRNNPKNADEWRDPRRVRAKLVAWLCTNGQARNLVHPRGIQVYGADIRGALEL